MRRSTEDLPEFIPADGKSRPLSEDEYSEITLGESEVEELSWLKLNYPRGGLKPENLISSLEGFEQEHLNLYAFTAALNSKNHAWAVEHWRWQQVRHILCKLPTRKLTSPGSRRIFGRILKP